jgi:HlyD family secretion protein
MPTMNDSSTPQATTPSEPAAVPIEQLLGDARAARWWRRPAPWIGLALLVALAGGAWWWQGRQAQRAAPVYVTAPLERGDITLTVTANGTLQPTRSGGHRQRAVGHRQPRVGGCQRPREEGPGAGRAGPRQVSGQVNRSRAALAAEAGGAGAERSHGERGARQPGALRGGGAAVGGQVPSAAELDAARATLAARQRQTRPARAPVWHEARATLSPPTRTCRRPRSARPSTASCWRARSIPAMPWRPRCRR